MMKPQIQTTSLPELISLHSYLSQAKQTDKMKQMLERTEVLMRQAVQNLRVNPHKKDTSNA